MAIRFVSGQAFGIPFGFRQVCLLAWQDIEEQIAVDGGLLCRVQIHIILGRMMLIGIRESRDVGRFVAEKRRGRIDDGHDEKRDADPFEKALQVGEAAWVDLGSGPGHHGT